VKVVVQVCAVLLLFTAVVAIAPSSVIGAQQGQNCDQIVGQINNVAAAINQNATSYWAYRENYVELMYGPSSRVVPNAMQLAEQQKSQADVVKQGMPGNVASLKGLVAAAQNGQGQNNNGQGCLTPAQQSTIVGPSIKQGKRVNFDLFPEEVPESIVGPGPPQMPR
jgi:hypothetical protein